MILVWGTCPVRAELQFEQTTVNLGKIRCGVPLVHSFQFVNSGKDELEIVEVRPGCGCVAPSLKRRLFPPGQKGAISLEVNTLTQSAGPHRWYVYVEYRQDQEKHQIPLEVLGEVITEVTVQPASLTIHAAQSMQQDLRLTDLRATPLTIKSLRTTSPLLQAAAGQRFRDEQANWVTHIHLQLTEGFPEGRHEEFLYIDTDDALYAQLKIPVTVVKQSTRRISATPDEVVLQAGPGQPIPSRILLLRDAKDEPIVIEEIKADHPAVRCKWAGGPGAATTVRVTVDRSALTDNHLRSAVHIRVNWPVSEVLTIQVNVHMEPDQAKESQPK